MPWFLLLIDYVFFLTLFIGFISEEAVKDMKWLNSGFNSFLSLFFFTIFYRIIRKIEIFTRLVPILDEEKKLS